MSKAKNATKVNGKMVNFNFSHIVGGCAINGKQVDVYKSEDEKHIKLVVANGFNGMPMHQFGVKVLRTDLLGTIILKSNGHKEEFSFRK